MVTCGTTNALSLQEGSRVCFFRFPLEFGVPLARFLHIEPRRLNKSTAVAEIPEGTVRALAAIFKCVQGMVLVLLCRLQLVDRVLLRSEHNVAISRLLHHNVPRVLERFVHLDDPMLPVRVVLSGVVVTAVAFVPPVRTFVLVTAEACSSGVPTARVVSTLHGTMLSTTATMYRVLVATSAPMIRAEWAM